MSEKSKSKIMSRLTKPAFYIAILGALKLITDAMGVQIISDDQVNSIANGLSALATVFGVSIGWE